MMSWKLFVKNFYKSNAGFFLFFFFLFFGTVNGSMLLSYHLSLIQSIINSGVVTAGVMVLWFLYNIKCIRFCQHIIHGASGSFLCNLQACSNAKQYLFFAGIHLLLYMPVLIYALIVSIVAMQQQQLWTAFAVLLFISALVIGTPFIYCYNINSSWKEKRSFLLHLSKRHSKPKRFVHYLLYYLLQEKWQAVVAIKTFSLLLLYLMFLNGKDTGHEFLVLVFLVILLAHIKIPFQLIHFLEGRLGFYRNLPLSTGYIALVYVYSYAVLLLPDILFLMVKSQGIFASTDILWFYGYGVLTLFLLTAVLYTDSMNMNEYIKVVFGLLFVSVFGLYSHNYAVLLTSECVISVLLFWNGYARYEATKIN